MKRKGSEYAIKCDPYHGPRFGKNFGSDICIRDNCNRENSCYIDNDGEGGYECHPKYKSSLFAYSGGANERNEFTVLDYEVYCIDN